MGEPYCGPAPTPASLSASWTVDPVALLVVVTLAAIHLASGPAGRRGHLLLGLGLFGLLFMSPLCALTGALFSARAAHHVLLVGVVAPLLALAFPARPDGERVPPLGIGVAAHAIVLWFWHAPDVYAAAIYDAVPYWLMQVSLLASAFVMWRGILASRDLGPALFALLATVVQMGMLGALLTFAARPLYAPHLFTTEAFGLSPLDDQRLAGLVMWVPAALPYIAAALLLVTTRFAAAERVARR